jgi:hypothetical protein
MGKTTLIYVGEVYVLINIYTMKALTFTKTIKGLNLLQQNIFNELQYS